MTSSTTTSSVLAVVQAHPSRRALLASLTPALEPLEVEVVEHVSTPPSPWDGYRNCLTRGLASHACHLLLIQDDAVPCKNFGPAVERIAEAHPERVVSFFVGGLPGPNTVGMWTAQKEGRNWLPLYTQGIHHVVCLLWPREKAREFLDWAIDRALPGGGDSRSDDAIVGYWARLTQNQIYATVPCLVEHPDMEPSTIGRKFTGGQDKGRKAAVFIGDVDPLEIDWA